MVLRPSSRALEAPLAETFTNNLLRLIPSLNHHWIISGTLGTTWLEVAWCCLSVHPHTYTSKVNWSQSFPIPFYLEKSSDSLHQIVFSPQHQEFALTAQIKWISVQYSILNWSSKCIFWPMYIVEIHRVTWSKVRGWNAPVHCLQIRRCIDGWGRWDDEMMADNDTMILWDVDTWNSIYYMSKHDGNSVSIWIQLPLRSMRSSGIQCRM